MNVRNKEVRDLIIKWAEDSIKDKVTIGYPPRNILSKLREEGGFLPRGTKKIDLEVTFRDDDVEEIERIFRHLFVANEDYYYAVRLKFLSQAKYPVPESIINTYVSRELKISIRTLQDRVKSGVEFISNNFKSNL